MKKHHVGYLDKYHKLFYSALKFTPKFSKYTTFMEGLF